MKKLIASVFTAVLMTTGLVMAQNVSADAVTGTNYAPSVPTATKVNGPKKVKHGKRVRIRPVVTTGAKGTIKVTIRYGKKVVKTRTVKPGTRIFFRAKKKGKYKITATFTPAANTVWKKSVSSVKVIRVK
jgi:hypothetical protein